MSTQLAAQEIKRFLASSRAEVLCIRGAWGVGKTFSWKSYLASASGEPGGIALKMYSYVSLFGLNSLNELKYAIFESRVPASKAAQGADLDSVENLFTNLPKLLKKNASILNALTGRDHLTAATSTFFLTVRDQIVCLDDLERRGAKLDTTDVLGLTSFLKEERNCKVVLLLNDQALTEDQKRTFDSYLEKVVDVNIAFSPSADECVAVAITKAGEANKFAAEDCRALGICNIRVIRKIERLVQDIAPLLEEFEPDVLRQVSKSLALFGWSFHQPDLAPPLEFLTSSRAGGLYGGAENLNEKEAAWNALLSSYGYGWTSELDLALIEGVKNGYFDPTQIRTHAAKLDKTIVAAKADGSFEEAWRLFHDSFADNEDQVLNGIFDAFMKHLDHISPLNLNGTVRLFKDLGRADQATQMIAAYVDGRDEERQFFDLAEYTFRGDVTDPEVIAAFDKKAASMKETRDIRSMLVSLKSGWSEQELLTLAAVPAEDYRQLLKAEENGQDLRTMLTGALQFDNIVNSTKEMKEISTKVRGALRQIGEESPLNARRVAKYGITADQPRPKRSRRPSVPR